MAILWLNDGASYLSYDDPNDPYCSDQHYLSTRNQHYLATPDTCHRSVPASGVR